MVLHDWKRQSSLCACQLPLHHRTRGARRSRHWAFRSEVVGRGEGVWRFHVEVANFSLQARVVVETDVFEVTDICEDAAIVGVVGGVKGGGFRGFRAGKVGR